jgi:putative ABC transport system permease protein
MMSVSNMVFLLRARLRSRVVLVQECFALFGIAVGVALLFSSQVASTSLSRSVAQIDKQVVGDAQFQLDARGPNGFDERLLGAVRAVPGVQTALPVLEQEVDVIGPNGQQRSVDLIGTDPRFAAVGGSLLRRFSARELGVQRAIALPAPLAREIDAGALEPVKLQVGSRIVVTLLGATLGEREIGDLVNSPIGLAPVRYAQRLTGMQGKVTRIFVRCQPGREHAVQAALGRLADSAGLNLEPADYDSRLFAVAVAPESKSEDLFSAISALVGFMFALNAMLITVPARRRLISEVRLQGATRGTLVQILLFDALVLGVLACAIGLALGDLLSVAVFHTTPGYLSVAFPIGNDRIVTWQSVALAVGAGMAAALVGVMWPLHDVLARSPLAQDKGTATGHRGARILIRLAIGCACIAFAAITPVAHNQGAIVGNAALVIALVCLLPLLFDWLVAAFERIQRPWGSAASALAVIELQTSRTRVRSLAIAATAAIAVFGTVEFQGIQRNLTNGLQTAVHGIDSSADVWVIPRGEADAFDTIPFADTYSRALARLPGVAAVGLYRGSFLDWGAHRLWVLAPPASAPEPIPPGQIVSGEPALARMRIRGGGWAAISQALAAEHHLRVGQTFELPAPRPIRLGVAAIVNNLGWSSGALIMNAADYARAWRSGDPSAYAIQVEPNASSAAVRSEVARALGSEAGLVVQTAAQRERYHYALAAQGLSRLTQIRLLVLIAAVLAVTAAMGSMVLQRRDLIAFMKVDGYRRGVLWRWLLCESAVLLATGCSIGAVFGLYAQLLGSHFLASVTGFPVVYSIQAFSALWSFALVVLIAVAMTAVPGYLAVRVAPRAVSPAY